MFPYTFISPVRPFFVFKSLPHQSNRIRNIPSVPNPQPSLSSHEMTNPPDPTPAISHHITPQRSHHNSTITSAAPYPHPDHPDNPGWLPATIGPRIKRYKQLNPIHLFPPPVVVSLPPSDPNPIQGRGGCTVRSGD